MRLVPFILALVVLLAVVLAPGAHSLAGAPRAVLGTATKLAAFGPQAVVWTAFSPAGWVTALPLTTAVTASNISGLEASTAAYATSTDGGFSWTPWSIAGLTASGAISTTLTVQVSGLSFPDSASANLIRFDVQETGGASQVSPDYPVRVDTTLPSALVTSPVAGYLPMVSPLSGTATDGTGSGLNAVQIALRHADATYWTGSGWTLAETWLAVGGLSAWSYAGVAPAWVDGVAYSVRARAIDVAGNTGLPSAPVAFTLDRVIPSITLLTPNGGESLPGGVQTFVTWSASDAVGLADNPITLSVSYNGGGVWQTLATGLANSGSYGWTPPPVDNTQVKLRVDAVDRAGNAASDASDAVFTVDSTAPATPLDLQATPLSWAKVDSFTVTWSNPPGSGALAGAWYKLDAAPTSSHDGLFVPNSTFITSIAVGSDGAHPIYVWLQDAAGLTNHLSAATTTLYLDRTPPSPPFGLLGSPARIWTKFNSFAETWTNPPDLSGVVGVYYRLNSPGTSPTDGTFVASPNSLTGMTMPGDGKHDLYLWLVDAAGNTSHLNRNVDPQVFWFDGSAPTSQVVPSPPQPANGWYSSTVTLSFSGTDPVGGSGLAGVSHELDEGGWSTAPSLTVAGEGLHTVSYRAEDLAANQEVIQQLGFGIDLTPPSAQLTPDRQPRPTGWYTATVGLSIAASDDLSGLSGVSYRLNGGQWQSGTQFQLSASGAYLIEYYAVDRAGLRSPAASTEILVDVSRPATAYLIQGTQGADGWFTSPLTFTLIPSDAGSGTVSTFYRIGEGAWLRGTQFTLTNDGIYVVSFYSVDVAGNIETSFPVQVKLDSTAPQAPTAVGTTPAAWSRVNDFSVAWANPTDLSGVSGVYYRLGEPPQTPTDGTLSPFTNQLSGLTVPSEGAHRLHLWLRDTAGNANHLLRAEAPLLRYDATPPLTAPDIQGILGTGGWFRSAVTVTMNAMDMHSGVDTLRYRIDGGNWVTGPAGVQLTLSVPDKHTLEFQSTDLAGNVESLRTATIRIDPDAPAAPGVVTVGPVGWQRTNSFRLTWRAPLDQSGIAGAYVKVGSAPTGPEDGVFYAATEAVEGVTVPAEGKHSVHLWLRDGAGNADHTRAVSLVDALWFDATPPLTVVSLSGQAGEDGWYTGPVRAEFTAADGASGLDVIRYRLDSGPWTTANGPVEFASEGRHTLEVSSLDLAGNAEAPQAFALPIDQQRPISRIGALARHQRKATFDVGWWGVDPAEGSGLATFDVEVREGLTGAWAPWLQTTTQVGAAFTGQRGHSYAFRVRAVDRAGNKQPLSGAGKFTVVDGLRNGNFDSGNFAEWTATGLLRKAVVPGDGPFGATALIARLGEPDYGPSTQEPGQVPVGAAEIAQNVVVPALNQVTHPTLSLWYRVFSYDVMFSQRLQRYVDTLDVTMTRSGQAPVLLLRDGNPTAQYGTLYDSGWKRALIDLTPFAGETVQLMIASHNREDNLFNTWSYVDDIQVQDWPMNERRFLAVATGSRASQVPGQAAAATPGPLPDVLEPDESIPAGKR